MNKYKGLTNKEKNEMHQKVADFLKEAKEGDRIVLCIDGKETCNDYPYFNLYEPDAKSADDWVNSICFWHDVNEKECELSFKLVKA